MKVLFVEDDPDQVALIKQALSGASFEVECATTLKDGVETARKAFLSGRPFDLYLIDFNLPDGKGTDVAERIFEIHPTAECVLLTASYDTTLLPRANMAGIQRIWLKDNAYRDIEGMVQARLNQRDEPGKDA